MKNGGSREMKMGAKRKTILNMIMVMSIVAIFAAGVLTVGYIQGWFESEDSIIMPRSNSGANGIEVIAQDKVGSVNIERSGIAYSLKDGNKLRDGDIIQTLNGSSISIIFGESIIYLDENSIVVVHISETGKISMDLDNGGMFADISDSFKVELMDTDITLESGIFSASAPYGSASVFVFNNNIKVGEQEVTAGNAINILQDGLYPGELSINSLNSFDLACIEKAAQNKDTYFTSGQIEQFITERENAKQEKVQAQFLKDDSEEKIVQMRQENIARQDEMVASGQNSNDSKGSTSDKSSDKKDNSSNKAANDGTANNEKKASNESNESDKTSENKTEESSEKPNSQESGGGKDSPDTDSEDSKDDDKLDDYTCTITIRCDTILDNIDNLLEGKNKYVPANGVILASSKIRFEEGETVFDVLKRACTLADIQLEYSWTPMYNSHYIEGINHLYEFDCGEESGWMYKVNGWFPNYGASAYTLKDGDTIVWAYTCKGLGADLGGSVY